MNCIICHNNVGKLSCLGEKGLRTIVTCSIDRGDCLFSNLLVEAGVHSVHEKCRLNYLHPVIGVKSEVKALVNEEKVFSWEVDCFLCAKALKLKDKKGKMRKVSQVSSGTKGGEPMEKVIVSMCSARMDEPATNICVRVSSVVSLFSVNARYHADCMLAFRKLKTTIASCEGKIEAEVLVSPVLNTTARPSVASPTRPTVTPARPTNSIVASSTLMFDRSFIASSHHAYLTHFAVFNSLHLLDTIGGGDCFFDSVSKCLAFFGIFRSVRELRLAAALELNLNSYLYADLFQLEQDVVGQATSYQEFVRRTRDENEWATELTISAMCRSIDFVIRVISTDTDLSTGTPTGFMQEYSVGVRQTQRVIFVAFNKQTAHYVAFVPANITRAAPVILSAVPLLESSRPVSSGRCIVAMDVDVFTPPISLITRAAPVILSAVPLPESSRPVSGGRYIEPMDVDVFTPHISVVQPILSAGPFADMVTPPLILPNQPPIIAPLIEPVGSHHSHPIDESQLTESDETIMDEARPCSVVGVSYDEQCQNCYRIGTASVPLKLLRSEGSFTRRYMSLLTVRESYLLCSDCHVFLGFTGKIFSSKLWLNGWPSVIAYLLFHPKHSNICAALWNLLPSVQRDSWHHLASSFTSPDHEHAFQDFTAWAQRYTKLITSGVIADFLTANDDYAFPCVKCPAGCHQYTDKCDALSFVHFIAWRFPGLSIFGGDSAMLTGARTDWPMRSLQLEKFVVAPGVVVDEQKGLCILLCQFHNGGLRRPIIHVPIHPTLGSRGFQKPDTIAAAVLTANVIRRGRLGKWSNSSHVIDCVGSYSGMSSTSISQRHENTTTGDLRFAAATLLAVNNREDVYKTIQNRYLNCENGPIMFQNALRFYDLYQKPDPGHLARCLNGGTVILASDAFAMHNSFFSRDSKPSSATSSTVESKDNQSIGLLFVIHHPPNSRHGHAPFDSCSAYPKDDEHVLIGTMLRLLVHCPPVHSVLVRSFDLSGNRFLGKLLGFVKKQVCKFQRSSSVKSFLNIKAAQAGLAAEVSRLKLVLKPAHCQMAADLLCAFSPSQIESFEVSSFSALEDLVLTPSHTVVLVYRLSSRSSRDLVPMQLGVHHLVACFGDSKQLADFHFRWSVNHEFWKVRRQLQGQPSESSAERQFQCPQWQLLVYVSGSHVDSMNEALQKSLGGQAEMRCPDHDLFLVQQTLSCTVSCCVLNCTKTARWKCLARGNYCTSAICLAHGRDIRSAGVVVNVEEGMPGRRLRSVVPAVPTAALPVPVESSSSGSESEPEWPAEIFAPIGQEDACVGSDDPALHSRKDLIPIYDVTRRIPGHFLWNKGYGVLRRRLDCHSSVSSSAMMQHIVSVTDDPCVSLLYPEGQLFPRTFWSAENSTIVGAIPSFMLNCLGNRADYGVASLNEHHTIRLLDGDLLTSKQNSYWHYLFDVTLNQKLTTYSSKLVFKRGLEFLVESPERKSDLSETKLPMDEADSTRRIKELACLLKKGKWTYFVTITINESETPGVREITRAIRRLAGGDELAERELTDAFLPFVLRAWERFTRVLFQELLLRNDTIMGKVKSVFVRHEFQDNSGNKSHQHAGITIEEEDERVTLARICCMSVSFASRLYGTDFDSLLRLGLVKNEAEFNKWRNIFGTVNIHDCTNAGNRCRKKNNKGGEKTCRVKRQPAFSMFGDTLQNRPWFETIHVPYTEEVYLLLQEMGLATKGEDQWKLRDPLISGQWRYPSRSDEFFLPSIPLLSAITLSSTNVQHVDHHFFVSYLVKYTAGVEERQLSDVSGSKVMTEVKVTTEDHAHEKITSCRKIMQQKEKNHPHQGREICLAEILHYLLGHQYSFCTASFKHVATLPLANRAAVLKFCNSRAPAQTVHERRVAAGLVPWRQFTDSQLAHADEYRKSSLCLDATSAFNIRPAELLIFDDLQLYHECFVAVRLPHTIVSSDLAAAAWLDCAGRSIMINSCSLGLCLKFLNERRASLGCVIAAQLLHEVFEPLERGDEALAKIFVKHNESRVMVAVISFTKPWIRGQFLTHLCLTLGKYATEMDVFCCGSVRESFFNAGLLPSSSVVTRADVISILKKYVVTDLSFHPISARQFNRYIMAALHTLTDELINDGLSNYTPYMSEIMLKDQATEQLTAFESVRRANLIDALYSDAALADLLPTNLRDASIDAPLSWSPLLRETDGVSRLSILEQSQALDCCVTAIESFLNPACRGVKFPLLVGRPGSGKSFVLSLSLAYAISRGLQCELLSYTSERARKLGGNHMHLVFPLPVSRSPVTVASSLASECLKTLQSDPLKQALIKRTDVFFYEEIGLLSSMMFSALDSILQFIMQNTLPFGGKLLISSGDSKQLPPISGAPLWSSVAMCTTMQVVVFKQDVRARDPNLRWLNAECRRNLDAAECEAVADRILAHCRIVEDWSRVPDNAVRIVSTRAAEATVMEQFLSTKTTTAYAAVDEVQNNTAWIPAVSHVTRRLDSAVYEYAVCRLFVGAVMRMTYNERHASTQFSQGQLALVTILPDTSLPFARQKLTLRLAPPGFRHIDPANIPPQWPEISIGRRTTPPLVVGRALQMGRRSQFPVRYHLTSTIHRIQGETVALYATQISEVDRHYRLWQKEQLTVLISRAQHCADMIFVGSPWQTKHAIISILARTSKWDNIVENYISSLDVLSNPVVREIRMELHPFLPLYRELPSACCGYVYMLVSMADARTCYVGETEDLKKCLREHNTGYGSTLTRQTELHPWGVFAFICGFECEDPNLATLKRKQCLRTLMIDLACGPEHAYIHMKEHVTEINLRTRNPLVIVKCGELPS